MNLHNMYKSKYFRQMFYKYLFVIRLGAFLKCTKYITDSNDNVMLFIWQILWVHSVRSIRLVQSASYQSDFKLLSLWVVLNNCLKGLIFKIMFLIL